MEEKNIEYRVSYSGGKDSTAMLLMLLEKKYPVDGIDWLDTGYEYREVYEYVDKVEDYIYPRWGLKINRVNLKPEWQFLHWFYGKYTSGKYEGQMRGFMGVLAPCYLSRQKGRTLDRINRSGDNLVKRYIGIGYNERHRKTKEKEFIDKFIYPLVDYWQITEDECIEYLKEKDLLPTYYDYYTRSGCWFCPKQSLQSIKSLYTRHPDQWEQLKIWEKESPRGWGIGDRNTEALEKRFNEELLEEPELLEYRNKRLKELNLQK